jgi:hypothetical protein
MQSAGYYLMCDIFGARSATCTAAIGIPPTYAKNGETENI